MSPADAIATVMADAQRLLATVMQDVTVEQLAWSPPEGAVPIGAIYAHAVGVEDLYIQQIIQGRPLLWESGGWAERLGDAAPPNTWNLARTLPADLEALTAYKEEVFANSLAYVRSLGGDDLDRALTFPGRAWSMSVAQLLAVVISHTASHAGEIALLKGLQGGRGLPY
jgi:uncharacterized damage-inducible protein DinB